MTDTLDITTVIVSKAVHLVSQGWHQDPFGAHDLRYHNGTDWTDHVTHFGPVPCQRCSRSFA